MVDFEVLSSKFVVQPSPKGYSSKTAKDRKSECMIVAVLWAWGFPAQARTIISSSSSCVLCIFLLHSVFGLRAPTVNARATLEPETLALRYLGTSFCCDVSWKPVARKSHGPRIWAKIPLSLHNTRRKNQTLWRLVCTLSLQGEERVKRFGS